MAFRYKEKFSISGFIKDIRDSLWNYPYMVVRIYKGLKAFKAVIIIIFLSFLLYLLYSKVYYEISNNQGLSKQLTIGIVNSSNNYNIFSNNNLAKDINNLVFSTLFNLNNQNIPLPSLAASWQVNSDETQIVFNLTKNVTWQDGKAFSADDVVYSFDLQKKINPGSALSLMGIKKIDANTVEVDQTSIDNNIWQDLYFPILPDHTVYSSDEEIGTGPYILVQSSGNTFSLTRNDTYFKGVPKITNLTVKVYQSDSDLYNAFTQGDINFYKLYDTNNSILSKLLNDHIDSVGSDSIISNYNALFFNMNSLKDTNIRQGISFSVNKNSINTSLSGYDTVDYGPFNPLSWAASNDLSIQVYRFSMANALASFKKAGYSQQNGKLVDGKGNILTLTISYDTDSIHNNILDIIKQNLQSIGIDIILQGFNQTQWTNQILINKNFQIAYTQVQNAIDPDPYGFWYTGQKANLSSYTNDDVDHTLAVARNITSKSQRQIAYFLFQRYLMNDDPAVFLYSPNLVYVAKPNIVLNDITSDNAFESDIFNSIQTWSFK